MKRRDLLVMAQQVLQVGLDLVMALLELGQDRKDPDRVLAAQRRLGHAAQDHVRHLEIEISRWAPAGPGCAWSEVKSGLFWPTEVLFASMAVLNGMTPWGGGILYYRRGFFQDLALGWRRG